MAEPVSDQELLVALRAMGLVGAHEPAHFTPLAGGVSSDVYRVDLPHRVVCVKRALAKLKVAADWRAPVERNRYEAAWMREAALACPGCVPEVLAESREHGAFAMTWFPPDAFPVWKGLLRDGCIEATVAFRIGEVLGTIHRATADRRDLAARFATDDLFYAIRLEPYLVATASMHPDLQAALHDLVRTTARTRRVLVHGDFSPKNLLIGAAGPIILDAECAWFGDPAFDLAFVLKHLVLKTAWKPQWRERYLDAYAALMRAYAAHVNWEPWIDLDARTARLLPALVLARVDGKSPVEYLDERQRGAVRHFARSLLIDRPADLAAIATRVPHWRDA